MLRLVIPKGSLEGTTLELLESADLKVHRGGERSYHAWIDDPRIGEVSILRPQEIPKYVEEGLFDLGVTGYDWITEQGADVVELADLPYSKMDVGTTVKLVLAVAGGSGYERAEDLPEDARISTEYPNLVGRYFRDKGKQVRVYLSYGATEAKIPEIADAIVELTETGSTLRKHGLVIIETVLESTTRLITNHAAWGDPEKRKVMEEVKILILGALNARGKVLLKFNVAEGKLDEVVGALPSMKSPTVSKLFHSDYYAVESVVEKAGINLLIPSLVEKGAEDILELPISKIVY
jgi:ATP phosphoribosyltransferase